MLKEDPEMDDEALLAELERNLKSEYGSETQSVDSFDAKTIRSSTGSSPGTQSPESSLSKHSKRNSIEDMYSINKVNFMKV